MSHTPHIVHFFTDSTSSDNVASLKDWFVRRSYIQNTFFAIILCTDEDEIKNAYRPWEHRVRGQFGWVGATCGIPGVDVTEDFRAEKRDVLTLRGWNYSFTFGDFIAKALVGVVDPSVHIVGLPAGTYIYSWDGSDSQGTLQHTAHFCCSPFHLHTWNCTKIRSTTCCTLCHIVTDATQMMRRGSTTDGGRLETPACPCLTGATV